MCDWWAHQDSNLGPPGYESDGLCLQAIITQQLREPRLFRCRLECHFAASIHRIQEREPRSASPAWLPGQNESEHREERVPLT